MKVQENKQKQPDQDRIQEFCEYIKDVYYQHDTLNVGKIFKVLEQENLKPDQKIYYKIVQIAIKKQDLRSIIKCFEYFNKENQDKPNFEEEQQAMIQNLFKQISFGNVNKDELRQFLLDLKRHILPQHLGYITDQSVKFQVVEPILFFFDHYKNNVSTQIQTLKSFKALTYKQTNQFYQSLVYKYLQLKEIEDHVGCLLLEITLKFNDIQLAEILFEKLESYSKDLQSLYQTMIRNIPPQKNYQVMVRYFNKMKEIPSVEINEVTFGQVIDCCVKNNQLNLAHQLLNDNKYSNCIVYTTLIKGYSKEKNFDQANKIFQQMKKSDDPKIKPNMVTYNSMLECSIQCQRFEEMQQIYKEITQQEQNQNEQGIKADLITHSTFIKGLCKARYIDQALELFDQIRESKQYDIDEVLYNSLLDGLLKIQECKLGLKIYDKMLSDQVKESNVTYSILIKIYTQLEEYDKAYNVLNIMKEKNIQPSIIVYTCLIQVALRTRNMVKLMEIYQKMKNQDVQGDQVFFNTILVGLLNNQFYKYVIEIFKDISEQKIVLSQEVYTNLLKALTKQLELKKNQQNGFHQINGYNNSNIKKNMSEQQNLTVGQLQKSVVSILQQVKKFKIFIQQDLLAHAKHEIMLDESQKNTQQTQYNSKNKNI